MTLSRLQVADFESAAGGKVTLSDDKATTLMGRMVSFNVDHSFESLADSRSSTALPQSFDSRSRGSLLGRWSQDCHPCFRSRFVALFFFLPLHLALTLYLLAGKFSIRLVPDLTPSEVNELVTKYLNEEFAKLGSKNTFKVEMLSGGMPWVASSAFPCESPFGDARSLTFSRFAVDHWNFKAGTKATETVYNKTPDYTREGGSIP